jgi:creatinine amidohydrolase
MNSNYSKTEIASLSWTNFDKLRAEKPLVVIPTGAVEVYGPHLPLASDSIAALEVARLVAEKLGCLCAPLIPVGYSADLMSFPGTLMVKPEIWVGYLDGICRSLVQWGLTRFVYLNTHLGNVTLIDQEADLLSRECGCTGLQIDWWRYAARVGKDDLKTDWAVGHAAELGTSILLYFAGDLVDRSAQVDFIPDYNPWPAGLTRYESYREITPTGVMGHPSAGSYEQGERIVKKCIESIARDCLDYFKMQEPG